MPKNILPKNICRNAGVYALTFGSKHVYIGSSVNIRTRGVKHLVMLKAKKHYSEKLTSAYAEWGIFEVSVLEECKVEELKTREQHYIDILSPGLNLYQKTTGSTVTKNSLAAVKERMQRPNIKEKIRSSITIMHANMSAEDRAKRGRAISEGKSRTPVAQKEAAKAAQRIKVSQPVISDCGKSFISKASAAEHLGVTQSAVCQAIRAGRAISGMMLHNKETTI